MIQIARPIPGVSATSVQALPEGSGANLFKPGLVFNKVPMKGSAVVQNESPYQS